MICLFQNIKEGKMFNKSTIALAVSITVAGITGCSNDSESVETKVFNRIATYPVCMQIDSSCNTDDETAAEIVAASEDGNTLVYSDSPAEKVGFVDISNSASPVGLGTLAMGGEPTSVAVKGNYALVGVNTSTDFVNTSGELKVVDITDRTVVATLTLAGQPDSVAVSPDGLYAAVAIENERDEDHVGGADIGINPQLPAGSLDVIDISDAEPTNWSVSNVSMIGLADIAPTDPEPEFVDINSDNIAVVTMQENNHIALVDLVTGTVINDFTAGSTNLSNIDTSEAKPRLIELTDSQPARLREPDGVVWIDTSYFATADEGDMNGGSRGYTIFDLNGNVVHDVGNELDLRTVRLGHYPEKRSENKGNEPENVKTGTFGKDKFLFVNSERSSLVFVYNVNDPTNPIYKQTLPAGVGPEGALTIASRNLLIVASEKDNRGDKMRSSLNIYEYGDGEVRYPTLQSVDNNGVPIAWGAMSGLAADINSDDILYAVEDSFYGSNRIFTIDISKTPAELNAANKIMDSNDVFASISTSGVNEDLDAFDDVDLATMISADKSVNIDPEGIALRLDGAGFWVVSEGAGTVFNTTDATTVDTNSGALESKARPIEKLNLIFKTDTSGVIEEVIELPAAINDKQRRFGFEGVTEYNGKLYVAFQRAWVESVDFTDPLNPVSTLESNPRIGVYDLTAKTWMFYFYPLDAATSQNGGWVGVSDITSLGNGEMLVVERDNQAGPDASIKRLYKFSVASLVDGDTVSKTLVDDLIDDLRNANGLVYEKVEGSAVLSNGDIYIINDNDGVDDNSGETQLMKLQGLLQ
ncbi:MAG: alkaline phosphatase [endosymbiont of Galathealinum brachiosum]|uniref:Alkaline phosphatase n=1 Tax=endosymbiont of Galathealinum brachiosum TaxID=2200906 RepID=A0A370DHY4_9GAMM|nr:MAG: alkaline phosphatase [endosymbiont of Galathealinum brachiosum]